MNIILNKKPKNTTIIQGFPGIGLVGTIATEFLLEHLKTEQIGRIKLEDIPPAVAIHEHKIVDPFGIFYNKKYNLIIVHAIAPVQGFEWVMSKSLLELSKTLQAKELIAIEGVAGGNSDESGTYGYSKKYEKKLEKAGVKKMKEGIIMGVTGALLMSHNPIPITCLFGETHSNLPDSKAAAGILKALDKYLGLKVDYKPLLAQAETFEKKLQGIMKQGEQSKELSDAKRMSYVG